MRRIFLLCCLVSSIVHAQTVSVHLDQVSLVDFVKLAYGEIARRPYVMSPEIHEVRHPVTVLLRDEQPSRVLEHAAHLLQQAGFKVEQRAGVAWIRKADKEEDAIVVYRPKYRSARYLADVVQPLTGARSLLSRDLRVQEQQPPLPQHQSMLPEHVNPDISRTSVAGMTDRGEVDQIAFLISSKQADKLRKLLADLDQPQGEIFLKAAVYEVGISRKDGSALQLALQVSRLTGSLGTSISGGASIKLAAGGLEVVLSALDADSRFRSLSRPQVRVKNGAIARFSVGQDVPVIGAQQLDRLGNPIQSVEYKQSGVILSVKPEIREGIVELDLTQELSSFVQTNTGVNNSPTLIKRAVNTRLSLTPGEVIILAGLQSNKTDEQASRVPFIGWLLDERKQEEQTEILVLLELIKI